MPSRIPETEARQVMLDAALEPLEPYPGSTTPWKCRCKTCGAEVTPRFHDIKQRGRGCRNCGKARGGMARRLRQQDAIAVMVAAGLTPLEAYPGRKKPWRCRCDTCGAEVTPRLNSVKQGSGCRLCAYENVERYARVPADEASAVMVAAGLTPLEPYTSSRTPWRCRCDTCGAEVTPTFGTIRHGHGGCIYCGGKAPLNPEHAAAVMVAAGLTPLDPYPGKNDSPWRCRCESCGNEVTPRYSHIDAGRGGCPFCSDHGFNPGAPAIVYLIQHDEFAAVKVGITGCETERVSEHRRNGWTVVTTWNFEVGMQAEEVERSVLSWWRDELQAPQGLEREHMPQRGETETAWLADVDINETVAFIERLVAAD